MIPRRHCACLRKASCFSFRTWKRHLDVPTVVICVDPFRTCSAQRKRFRMRQIRIQNIYSFEGESFSRERYLSLTVLILGIAFLLVCCIKLGCCGELTPAPTGLDADCTRCGLSAVNVLVAADEGLEANFLPCNLSACLSACMLVFGGLARADAGRERLFLSAASMDTESDGVLSFFLLAKGSLFSFSSRDFEDPCAADMPVSSLQDVLLSGPKCGVFLQTCYRGLKFWELNAKNISMAMVASFYFD
jgi:hypothetical protein